MKTRPTTEYEESTMRRYLILALAFTLAILALAIAVAPTFAVPAVSAQQITMFLDWNAEPPTIVEENKNPDVAGQAKFTFVGLACQSRQELASSLHFPNTKPEEWNWEFDDPTDQSKIRWIFSSTEAKVLFLPGGGMLDSIDGRLTWYSEVKNTSMVTRATYRCLSDRQVQLAIGFDRASSEPTVAVDPTTLLGEPSDACLTGAQLTQLYEPWRWQLLPDQPAEVTRYGGAVIQLPDTAASFPAGWQVIGDLDATVVSAYPPRAGNCRARLGVAA